MPENVQELIRLFRELSPHEQRLATKEIMRIAAADDPSFPDEQLSSEMSYVAFRLLDEEERKHGAPDPW